MHVPLFLLASALLSAGADANWPQFRGPHGRGLAAATGLPVHWGEQENVVWKTAIHDKGWSSPVIWGNQVWLTTARADGKELYALCIDRTSGQIIHDRKVFTVEQPAYCHPYNSYASPTPAIEEGRVYVHFGTYGTACLDTASGQTLWQRRDLSCNHYRGPGSSPVLFRNRLFVVFDGIDVQYLAALDKSTGRIVWKKERAIRYNTSNGDLKKAYGTPTVITVDGRPQLVSSTAMATLAYDPETGEEIWKVYHGGMNSAAPPQYDGKHLFLCSGDGGMRLLAVRPDGHGDVTATHIDWKCSRNVPSRTAPLVFDGRLYMVNEGGMLSCLDADTGKSLWQERLKGKFCSSPILADGKLYLFSEEGTAVVGTVGTAWKKLATNQLADGCMASPAAVGRALLVRTRTHLYRLGQKD